jgi:hypothetical protein
MTLTAKQENFAKAIALQEMNYSDAYRHAYDSENMKPETINRKAKELIDDGKVAARVKELKDEIDERTVQEFVKTKVDLLKELEDIKKEAKVKDDLKEQRECVKEQGKMQGYYEDNLNVKGDISLVHGLTVFRNRKKNTNN